MQNPASFRPAEFHQHAPAGGSWRVRVFNLPPGAQQLLDVVATAPTPLLAHPRCGAEGLVTVLQFRGTCPQQLTWLHEQLRQLRILPVRAATGQQPVII